MYTVVKEPVIFIGSTYVQIFTGWFTIKHLGFTIYVHVKTIGTDLGVSNLYANHINAMALYLYCKNH